MLWVVNAVLVAVMVVIIWWLHSSGYTATAVLLAFLTGYGACTLETHVARARAKREH